MRCDPALSPARSQPPVIHFPTIASHVYSEMVSESLHGFSFFFFEKRITQPPKTKREISTNGSAQSTRLDRSARLLYNDAMSGPVVYIYNNLNELNRNVK